MEVQIPSSTLAVALSNRVMDGSEMPGGLLKGAAETPRPKALGWLVSSTR